MTNEDKKKILMSYLDAEEEVIDLCNQIDQLRSQAEKVTTTISGMPQATGGKGMEDVIVVYMDMLGDLAQKVRRNFEIKRDIDYLISTVDNWQAERVMRLRYIEGLEWDEVAKRVNYCKRQAQRYLDVALEFIEIDSCPTMSNRKVL